MKKSFLSLTLILIFKVTLVYPQWVLQGLGYEMATSIPTAIEIACPDVVWVGLGDQNHTLPLTYSKTINGGQNWTLKQLSAYMAYQPRLIESIDTNIAWIYALKSDTADYYKILKTTDGGQTWIDLNVVGLDTISIRNLHFYNQNEGILIGYTSINRFFFATTPDGGNTWIPVSQANIPQPISSSEIINNYDKRENFIDDNVFVITNKGRLLISHDKGFHWVVKNTPLFTGNNVLLPTCVFFNSTHGIIYQENGSIFETFDEGNNWQNISPAGPYYHNITYVPGTFNTLISSSNPLVNGFDPGCSFSTDGGHNWTDYPELSGKELAVNSFFNTSTGWVGAKTTLPSPALTGIYKFTGYFSEILEIDPQKGGISLYPNPSVGNVNAVVIGFEGKEIDFNMFNRLGQVVYSESFLQSYAQSEKTFDFGYLPKGVYMGIFRVGERIIVKKIVIR
ncbi:MAG: T9SS type A sorting domain-containing protein [Bacteroidota bacterium]